jgi:tetratricopeptide (TPR) repeat protein
MAVEQTERVADVVASALECARNERAQFLTDVCGDNVELREEAESFLRFEEPTRDFLEMPAWEMADVIVEHVPETLEPGGEHMATAEATALIESKTMHSTRPPDFAMTELPNEPRNLFEVPPFEITEGEIPIVDSSDESVRRIDSAKPVESYLAEPETEAPGISAAEIPPAPVFETAAVSVEEAPVLATTSAEQGEMIEPAGKSHPEQIDTPTTLPITHREIPPEEVSDETAPAVTVQPLPESEKRIPFPRFDLYDAARVLAIALLLIAVGALIRAREKSEELQHQREIAEMKRAEAERLTNFLQRTFSFSNENITSIWPVPQRKEMTVAEMLDRIAPRIEKEFRDRPDLHAGMLRMVGSAYASQGKYVAAERNLRAAFGAQVRLHGEENSETAATMVELGILSARQLKPEEAQRLLERAIAFYRKQESAKSPALDARRLALALGYLGETRFRQGDTTAGVADMEAALRISSAWDPQDSDFGVQSFNKGQLGSAYVMLGDNEKGERLLREAVGAYRRNVKEPRWEAGQFETMLGVAALNRDQPNEAQKYLEESERVLRQTLGDNNLYLVSNLDYQAAALAVEGKFKPAEEKARQCLALSRAVSPNNKLPWAGPLRTLGNILTLAGRTKEGEENYRDALAICERQQTRNFSLIVPMKIQLCHLLLAERRLTEAENLAFEAQNEAQQHFDEQDPVRKAAANNLIQIYKKQGKDRVAETVR